MSVSRGEAWKRYMSRGNVFAHFYMEWSVNSLQFALHWLHGTFKAGIAGATTVD